MILLNVYGKIEPLIISRKLGIEVSNLPNDWVLGFQDDLAEEILLREQNIRVWGKTNISSMGITNYKPSELVKAANWSVDSGVHVSDLQIIAENLIGIQMLDLDNSYMRLKNEMMDSPSCETSYPYMFIKFCCTIQNAFSAKNILHQRIPFCTYSSDEFNSKPLILNFLSATMNYDSNTEKYKKECISSLIKVGAIVDNFLESEEDFWMFDYIINSMFFDQKYNAYHIFKVMSLIEMLIINPNGTGKTVGELESKLPQFLTGIRVEDTKRTIFAEIMRKLRNKIAHGDFKAVQQLLERYRTEFMGNYDYDEFEYSIENWTYLSICCALDEILSEIIWQLITNKSKIRSIQIS
ncbi:hypothetical protein ACFRAM_13610 [Paenibacillus sp. NPDC056722]|uniref:hypothetical protein n=1 Tax=Paenibacillus sp. NPDC056722 TaxID=3345924 RepID=UPI0036BD1B92